MLCKREGKVPIHQAVSEPKLDVRILEYLVERDPACVKTRRVGGVNTIQGSLLPLSVAIAAIQPRLEVVECLLRLYPGAANEQDGNRAYPLHLLCMDRRRATTRDLVECLAAADPTVLRKRNSCQQTPIEKAIECRISADTIVAVIDLDPPCLVHTDKHGQCRLHELCCNDFMDVVDHCIGHYPQFFSIQDGEGRLPLHNGCRYIHDAQFLNRLIDVHPQGLGVLDKSGMFPIQYALRLEGAYPIHLAVIDRWPDHVFQARDKDGASLLHHALKSDACIEVMIPIVQRFPQALQTPDNEGRLPIHVACQVQSPPHNTVERLTLLVAEHPDSFPFYCRLQRAPSSPFGRRSFPAGMFSRHQVPFGILP